MAILRRAWRLWGWRGVSSAIARENGVHKLLTNERILGLDLLRGRKGGGSEKATSAASIVEAPAVPRDQGEQPEAVAALPHPADVQEEDTRAGPEDSAAGKNDRSETAGLPLFGGDEDERS